MNDMEKVFSIIDASRDEMIATLSRWIKIPSVQGDALLYTVVQRAQAFGFAVGGSGVLFDAF